jgi:hypothetical protein
MCVALEGVLYMSAILFVYEDKLAKVSAQRTELLVV